MFGVGAPGWIAAATLGLLALVHEPLRIEATLRRHPAAAAVEIGANLTALGLAAGLATHYAPSPALADRLGGLPPLQWSALCGAGAAALFLKDGGTHILRGLLDRVDLVPKLDDQRVVDEPAYNHGRTIGELERLLLLIFVLAESYTAVGVLIAAKGWIRVGGRSDNDAARQRAFSEYVVIGTLASLLLSTVTALLVRLAFFD